MGLLTVGLALAFVALAMALFAIQESVLERRRVYRGLRTVREIDIAPHDVAKKQLATAFGTRVGIPALRRVGKAARRFTPVHMLERLSKDLTYAGSPVGWDAERMVATKIATAAGLGALAFVLALLAGLTPIRAILGGILFLAMGFIIPDVILTSKANQRQEAIRFALADALDILSITVEAGLAFDAALARVSQETRGPLGEEFQRVLQEMQLGKTRSEAFRDLAERSTVAELKSFVLAMVQADIFGIAVSGILSVQAKEIRLKRRQAAEERAQKVPVKILFPLIFCIFPAMFVVLVGPAVFQIYRTLFHH